MQTAAQTVMIAGDTFRHKDTLRAMGGRWNATARVWEVPATAAPKALALSGLYASGGASTPTQTFTRATVSRPTRGARTWRPCGYPGCSPGYCDECQ